MPINKPLAMDFFAIRKSLISIIQGITGLTVIIEKRKGQTTMSTPRPALPYISIEFLVPAGKIGIDAQQPTGTSEEPSSVQQYGGVRRATVVFRAYAKEQEEAYNYLALLEGSFDADQVAAQFRAADIAFWESHGVHDVTSLLTSGFEGRALLDTYMGFPSRLNFDDGEMDTVTVTGEVSGGSLEPIEVQSTITGEE